MNKPQIDKTDWYGVKTKLELEVIVRKWIEFKNLPATTQQRIWDEYNDYYQKCKDSPLGKVARDMADALKRNDLPALDGLKQLNKDLAAMGEAVEKPISFSVDPMAFFHDQQVYLYKRALTEIERGKAKLSF